MVSATKLPSYSVYFYNVHLATPLAVFGPPIYMYEDICQNKHREKNDNCMYTAIPYRASTGPEKGFLCEVFSLQGTPVLIAGIPVFITGISL